MEPKYYFINYECNRFTSGHRPSNNYTLKCQYITDKHPIQWQHDCNEEYDKWRDDGVGGKEREEYRVISWEKLTLEEYKEFKDTVG